MAIGCVHTEWMFRLAERGVFGGGASVLDLGPQDVQVDRPWMDAACESHLGSRPEALDLLFEGDRARRNGQAAFYRLFGAGDYRSADLEDDRADYRLDLNDPPSGLPRFDVVTDFGTAEHVFDIARVLRTVHELLNPGGYALHVVPVFAFPNHGFYTANPNLFVEFARANEYRLTDFRYLDNLFVREQLQVKRPGQPFDFDSLPIRLDDMRDTQHFMTKVVAQYARNLAATETRDVLAALNPDLRKDEPFPSERFHLCFVFDLLFVAMQKPQQHRDLVAPIQNAQGVAPLPGAEGAGGKRGFWNQVPLLSRAISAAQSIGARRP